MHNNAMLDNGVMDKGLWVLRDMQAHLLPY